MALGCGEGFAVKVFETEAVASSVTGRVAVNASVGLVGIKVFETVALGCGEAVAVKVVESEAVTTLVGVLEPVTPPVTEAEGDSRHKALPVAFEDGHRRHAATLLCPDSGLYVPAGHETHFSVSLKVPGAHMGDPVGNSQTRRRFGLVVEQGISTQAPGSR